MERFDFEAFDAHLEQVIETEQVILDGLKEFLGAEHEDSTTE